MPDSVRASVLNEELNHAVQRAATGPLGDHLRGSAEGFIKGRLGSQAAQSLQQNLKYSFRSPGEAAAEIGVRLMQPGQYQELGLSRDQARVLGLQYVQALRKEYGNAAADRIGSRVFKSLGIR